MNKPYTYRQSFETEKEAMDFCDSIIGGGIVQKQEELWHVWQIN